MRTIRSARSPSTSGGLRKLAAHCVRPSHATSARERFTVDNGVGRAWDTACPPRDRAQRKRVQPFSSSDCARRFAQAGRGAPRDGKAGLARADSSPNESSRHRSHEGWAGARRRLQRRSARWELVRLGEYQRRRHARAFGQWRFETAQHEMITPERQYDRASRRNRHAARNRAHAHDPIGHRHLMNVEFSHRTGAAQQGGRRTSRDS